MNSFPEHIFKAYDIRGIYPDELNEELAYKIGRAYASLRQKELGKANITVVSGHDMRLSSPGLVEQLKQGLLDQGASVVDIGLSSTPTFYFAVSFYGYDGGALITASHNPKEYNGVKMVRDGAKPLGKGSGMEELQLLVKENNSVDLEKKGEITIREGVVSEQLELAKKYADISKLKPMKIVVDTANSMGATYLEKMFVDLPQIELVKMNWELDGTFPAHQADPFQEKNVVDLQKKIVEEGADLGIATDGDGDRIFFIDNNGKMAEPAIIRGIMAKLFLKDNPGATICYDIRPGKITEDMIVENGGVPSVTKVGHSYIKKQMLEVGAVFGGESSGHFFVKFPHGAYEAPMVVTLKLLQDFSESGKDFSQYLEPLRRYVHSGEINFRVEDKDAILNNLQKKYSDAKISDLDGLSFEYKDFWFNVRSSNTEPLLRLNLEARTEELMGEKLEEVRGLIENI